MNDYALKLGFLIFGILATLVAMITFVRQEAKYRKSETLAPTTPSKRKSPLPFALVALLIVAISILGTGLYIAHDISLYKTLERESKSYLSDQGFTAIEILGVSTEDCMPYHEIGFRFRGISPSLNQEKVEGFACAEEINGEKQWQVALLAYDPQSE